MNAAPLATLMRPATGLSCARAGTAAEHTRTSAASHVLGLLITPPGGDGLLSSHMHRSAHSYAVNVHLSYRHERGGLHEPPCQLKHEGHEGHEDIFLKGRCCLAAL